MLVCEIVVGFRFVIKVRFEMGVDALGFDETFGRCHYAKPQGSD